MLILEEAKEIAKAFLLDLKSSYKLVLIEEKIIELEKGFIFYWDSE